MIENLISGKYRWTLDGEEDGCVLDGGPGVDLDVEGEQVDLVRVEGPPVLGGANEAAVEKDAAVGRVHALHVTVQEVLRQKEKYKTVKKNMGLMLIYFIFTFPRVSSYYFMHS